MSSVSVEKETIIKSIAICNHSIQQYKKSAQSLQVKYREAGSGWHDAKYVQLGGVVNECTSALVSPIKELEECVSKLNELLRAIERYEMENL